MSTKLPIVAIVGRPNVGKSSLFNRLVGKRQAVVANEPGTTRDRVQNRTHFGGKDCWLVDTAGQAAAADELAQNVQGQINEARELADVILVVIDAATLTDADRRAAKLALQSKKPVVLAVSKIDTVHNKVPEQAQKLGIRTIVGVSALHGTGAEELASEIGALLPKRKVESQAAQSSLALLGRPNVGKSSLFNALIGRPQAIVSQQQGTTRDVNRAELKHHGTTFTLLDTAGYRKIGKTNAVEHFSILRSLEALNESDVAILVLDATEPATALDQKLAGLVKEAGKGLVLALNKWDLLKDEEGAQKQLEKRLQAELPYVWWAPLVLTSATTGHNVKKLVELGQKIIETRKQKLATKELNALLQQAMAAHPPAGLKNRHPKLNYVTQTGENPPQITLFGAQLEFLHWSYKRYLENELRKAFDFSGTPIDLQFRSKYKD